MGRGCVDPAEGVILFDAEFSELADKATWVDESNPYSVKIRVATIDGSGDFVSPAIVDQSADILGIVANLYNGPEWVYNDGGYGMGIVYTKLVDSTATIHWAYFDSPSWVPVSLEVDGRTPMGTMVQTSVAGGAVMYARGSSLFGYDHFMCHLSDCDGTEEEVWPLSIDPPDLMRFAEVNDVYAPPTLVGVNYEASAPHPVFEWTEAAPSGTNLVTDSPSKFKGWKWYSPEADEVLVLTSDQIFASPNTGPGLIKIYKTNGDLWQVIPVGRNDYPYIGSIEPFVDHTDTSWIIYSASEGKYPHLNLPTRVIMAQVSDEAVGGVGIDPTLTIRQVDEADEGDGTKWKDPEGYTDGTNTWVYMTGTDITPDPDLNDTFRCNAGI